MDESDVAVEARDEAARMTEDPVFIAVVVARAADEALRKLSLEPEVTVDHKLVYGGPRTWIRIVVEGHVYRLGVERGTSTETVPAGA